MDRLFKAAMYIAMITAAAHLAIQLMDYRGLMRAAYVSPSLAIDYSFVLQDFQQWIEREEFVRLLPQGVFLILFFAVYMAASFLTSGWKRSRLAIAGPAILSLAIIITVSRNLLFSMLCGFLAAVLFSIHLRVLRSGVISRVAVAALALFGTGAAYAYYSPDFGALWQERLEQLSGVDSHIFSEDNAARGRDNLAALHAITDHPFLGVGTSRYPEEYSLRLVHATDTHPLLQVGLVGGIPAMFLAMRMQWLIVWGLLREIRRNRRLARPLAPFLAVLAINAFAVNLIGAGGTFTGNGLVSIVIFIAAAWSKCAQAAAEPYPIAWRVYEDFYPDAVLQPGRLHRADDFIGA
jgi:hypothetical protein